VLGQVLLALKLRWIESGFTLSPNDLLAMVPEVQAELLPTSPKADRKSRSLRQVRKSP
jgi:hypothetical protein